MNCLYCTMWTISVVRRTLIEKKTTQKGKNVSKNIWNKLILSQKHGGGILNAFPYFVVLRYLQLWFQMLIIQPFLLLS